MRVNKFKGEIEPNKDIKIKVVDAPCGYGKTHSAIDFMKKSNKDENFIFVTPYLKEVDRIKKEVYSRNFYEPQPYGSKRKDFHRLLKQGWDIATTHALFQLSTDTTKALIKANDYTLILDEVMDIVQETNITSDDLRIIQETNLAHIENYYLVWDDQGYDGKYNDIKAMANNKTLVVVDGKILLWKFPADIFESFKEVYILTYLFDAQLQKYYYDMFDIKYDYFTVNKKETGFVKMDNEPTHEEFKRYIQQHINIYQGKLNNIGEGKYTLSYTWFNGDKQKEDHEPLIEVLQKNTYTFFRSQCKTKSKYNMWTCFKKNKNDLKGKGYSRGFVPCTARATNEYQHKESCAYLVNRFMKPHFKKFFSQNNIKINEDLISLSELIQWVWRSRIRNGERINLYIPSERTRNIFIKWMSNLRLQKVQK